MWPSFVDPLYVGKMQSAIKEEQGRKETQRKERESRRRAPPEYVNQPLPCPRCGRRHEYEAELVSSEGQLFAFYEPRLCTQCTYEVLEASHRRSLGY